MEVYKDLTSQQSKKFEELLNSETAKNKIEEGSLVNAEITNISEKFVWVHLGMKSEAMIEVSEFKNLNQLDKIKIGQTIEVLLENSESKSGEIIVSLEKAHKQKGFEILKKAYEENKIITGEIIGKVKGGVIFKEKETGISTFMPGSQISSKPLKDISSLMNTEIKAQIIKVDPIRGNLCTSRRAVQTAEKATDKKEILSRYKVGDILKDCLCKNIASFGAFFEVNEGEFDVLCHLQELSYSRINSPEEILEVNKKYDLKIISIDLEKMQIGTSIKAMAPDPFDNIAEFEIGSDYTAVVKKILDYGIFVEIRSGLSALLHQSEISWTRKNINPKTFAKVNDRIKVKITEIDKEKRRIAVSHKLTSENPWEKFKNDFPLGSIVKGEVTGINEYALFVKLDGLPLEAFLHCNDLSYMGKPEDEIKKFKKNDRLEKLKLLECDLDNQKIRVSLKEAVSEDPFKFYDNYKEGDVLTCKVISIDNKGLTVKPEGSEIESYIKKSQLAISPGDQRTGRWTNGDRIDCLLEKKEKRKISLSIRALEEKLNADALEKFGDSGSGKSLPFASLSDKMQKKKKPE